MTRITKRLLQLGFLVLLSACLGLSLLPSQSAAALSSSDFDAGNIIDDSVFTNSNSMSVQEIQNFLNAKVPTCSTSHTGYTGGTGTTYNPPFVCLKDFYENPNSTYTVSFSYTDTSGATQTGSRSYYYNNAYQVTSLCPVYGGYSGTPTCGSGDYHNGLDHLIPTLQTSGLNTPTGAESAAQIIYNAAQQYTINPQVLIVLLQKEQGLVTDVWPASYEYQAATGYGCPDTAPCSSNYAGFSNQVISAAWQFRHYLDYPDNYNYVIGNNYIQYNPSSSCGGTTVNILNQATAALYDYTPYQPNPEALSGLSDTSPGSTVPCGAYGNRNFWWYFNIWFGSTHGELITAPGAAVYKLENGQKRIIPDAITFSSYGYKWSDISTISSAELSNIPDGTPLPYNTHYRDNRFVRVSDGVYLIENGLKRPVPDGITLLSYSYNWSDVLVISDLELSKIPDGAAVPYYTHYRDGKLVTSDGDAVYLVQNGLKRPIPDGATFLSYSYKWSDVVTISAAEMAKIPVGAVMPPKM